MLIVCGSYVDHMLIMLLVQVSYYKAQGDYYRPLQNLCFVSVCDPDRYGPIMDSVSMCLRYMAEINDDMDRTRATTAAKAAYEVAERKMRKGESMVKSLHQVSDTT